MGYMLYGTDNIPEKIWRVITQIHLAVYILKQVRQNFKLNNGKQTGCRRLIK